MASVNGEGGAGRPRPISALPSVQARALAFAAILVAGVCGGLIGFSAVRVGCHGKCATPEGIGGITGAIFATIGVSVIAVLVLRAMGEWRTIKEKRQLETMIAAASALSQDEAAHAMTSTASFEEPATNEIPPAETGEGPLPLEE